MSLDKKVLFLSNRIPSLKNPEAEHGDVVASDELDLGPGGVSRSIYEAARISSGGLWLGLEAIADGQTPKIVKEVPLTEKDFKLTPLGIPSSQKIDHYGIANSFFWLANHFDRKRLDKRRIKGLPQIFPTPKFSRTQYDNYRDVNRIVAHTIAAVVEDPSQVIQIDDYHFFLVAGMLRDSGVQNPIGYFNHTPIISAKNLLSLGRDVSGIENVYRECMDGALGNDFVAFHIPDYCCNFADIVEYLSVGKILEANREKGKFVINSRHGETHVAPLPIGLPVGHIRRETVLDKRLNYELRPTCGLEENIDLYTLLKSEEKAGRLTSLSFYRLDNTKGYLEHLLVLSHLVSQGLDVRHIQITQEGREGIKAHEDLRILAESETRKFNEAAESSIGHPAVVAQFDRGIGDGEQYRAARDAQLYVVFSPSDGWALTFPEALVAKHHLPSGQRGAVLLGNCGSRRNFEEEFPNGLKHGLLYGDPSRIEYTARRIMEAVGNGKLNTSISRLAIDHAEEFQLDPWVLERIYRTIEFSRH